MNIQAKLVSVASLVILLGGCGNNKAQNDRDIRAINLAKVQKVSYTNKISNGANPIAKLVFLTGDKTDSIYLEIKGELFRLHEGQVIQLEYDNADSLMKINSEPIVAFESENEGWEPILPPNLLDSAQINK